MRNNAFTVLELLVTIVILGILASLFLPALGMTREQVRRAQCANNLRQIGIAWRLYLDDHDETFPVFGGPAAAPTSVTTMEWGGKQGAATGSLPAKYRILNPYLDVDVSKSEQEVERDPALEIFHCPSDRVSLHGTVWGCSKITPDHCWHYQSGWYLFGNSYYLNAILLRYGTYPNWQARPLSTVTNSLSRLYLATDWEKNHGGTVGEGGEPGRLNKMVLFLDGHVKMYRLGADWEGENSPVISLPTSEEGGPETYP